MQETQFIKDTRESINAAREDIKSFLLGDLQIDKVKDPEKALAEIEKQADFCVQSFYQEIQKGYNYYLEFATPYEKEAIDTIVQKTKRALEGEQVEGSLVTQEDLLLFEQMVIRVMEQNKNQEASCMWRWLILLNPNNSRAWVGWALCESATPEIVQEIFRLGHAQLPFDPYLASYAADFFISQNQRAEAKQILEKTISLLNEEPILSKDVIRELQNQMVNI